MGDARKRETSKVSVGSLAQETRKIYRKVEQPRERPAWQGRWASGSELRLEHLKWEMLMRHPGRDFTEEAGCIHLEFSVWIETDNTYLGWNLSLWD